MELQPQTNLSWKKLFLGILGLNVFLGLLFFIFLLWPVSETKLPAKEFIEEESGAEFTITSSKQNLNELVNEYVDLYMKDKKEKYSVIFKEENVELLGSIKAFDTDIPVSIILEPVVQENGDLVLIATNMSLGLLQLPEGKILEYVKKEIKAPEWLEIDPKNKRIYIAVTQIELKSNFKVKVQRFDLKNDRISFRIKVPNKTLGL